MNLEILDNPIWFSLSTRNADLAKGGEEIRFFEPEVAPFAGMKSFTDRHFQDLFDSIAMDRVIVLFSPDDQLTCAPFNLLMKVPGYQMYYRGSSRQIGSCEISTLTHRHVPEMLALTKLAQPGPFSERTIEFGNYRGIFDLGKLVAMAGHRLQTEGYTEISAVCTHPDEAGKGYGRALLEDQINLILNSGNTPYLHVRQDNQRAIALYLKLGFAIRTNMYFYVLKKGF